MEYKIKKILASILSLDVNKINSSTSAEQIEHWDSLKHINIIIALEEEFNIEFNNDQIINMLDYDSIVKRITKLIS